MHNKHESDCLWMRRDSSSPAMLEAFVFRKLPSRHSGGDEDENGETLFQARCLSLRVYIVYLRHGCNERRRVQARTSIAIQCTGAPESVAMARVAIIFSFALPRKEGDILYQGNESIFVFGGLAAALLLRSSGSCKRKELRIRRKMMKRLR